MDEKFENDQPSSNEGVITKISKIKKNNYKN